MEKGNDLPAFTKWEIDYTNDSDDYLKEKRKGGVSV